jgi:prevent-host-death family protein
MTAVSISNARENLFPLVSQVNEDHIVVEIVARKGGNAVLTSAEDYESLQETPASQNASNTWAVSSGHAGELRRTGSCRR